VCASSRSCGLFFWEDEQARQEMLSFLSDHYRMYDYSISNFNRSAFALGKTEVRFVVLCGDGLNRTFEALAWIRSRSDLPVIMVGPAIERQCILALEAGADDYIARPVSLREMLARIRGILRFQGSGLIQQHKARQSSYLFGGWRYDDGKRQLTNAQGMRIFLTKTEYAVLKVFLDAPHRLLTRRHLANAVTSREEIADRTVNVIIFRLRRKLKAGGAKHDIIRSERGRGYAFNMDVKRVEEGP
jgi:two-component system, OmpR family, response regulator